MKKLIVLAMALSIFTLGLPLNSMAAEEPTTHASANNPAGNPPVGGAVAGSSSVTPVVIAAVSVLGFIALAASVDSGDATPTTTAHAN